MNKDIQMVADTVTEKTTTFTVTREADGWLDRLLVRLKIRSLKRQFAIKPPTLGLAHKVTALMAGLVIPKGTATKDMQNNLVLENSRKMAEIIATYVHGKKGDAPQWLVDYFFDNLEWEEMQELTDIIAAYMDIIPFIKSISSMRSLDLISEPLREESPTDTGEIIAPGD